ncbi:MAG: N-6 DNA methylase [Flavobacteriaceae bacterium]|nr:N-6 DNA methylase [Flavobacteriaceae bacterium]
MLQKDLVTFSTHWIENQELMGIKNPISNRFDTLRNDIEIDIANRKKKRIFKRDESLDLRPDTVKSIVKNLEHVDLFGIDEDLNGRLFETFLNATMRGRVLGQYFTPRSIVKLMTSLANLRADRNCLDKVLDACCGTGGFLIEVLSDMRNKIKANDSLTIKEKEDLINTITDSSIYGVDFGKDPPLARIARINMYLHGDGGSHIYYADALDKKVNNELIDDPEIKQNLIELENSFKNEKFDVVLTNPPFSMSKESKNPQEKIILDQYTIAKTQNSNKIRPSLKSSVMFFERYYDLLKLGGKLITVIDESILSSPKFDYVRNFIKKHFIIQAIISLPGDSFQMAKSRVKTSVLLLKKKLNLKEEQPNWFYFFANKVGIDDKPTKRPDDQVIEERKLAESEIDMILSEYQHFLDGKKTEYVLESKYLSDSLALRNCVPLFGRMKEEWLNKGFQVITLNKLITPSSNRIEPSNHPNKKFNFLKVSYKGYCEIESVQLGKKIKHKSIRVVNKGQLICSVYNALHGAIAIVPDDFDEFVVSESFMVFNSNDLIDSLEDMAYLQSVLRSHEIRADIQSLSTGSGRYIVKWPRFGLLQIPILDELERNKIGKKILKFRKMKQQIKELCKDSKSHLRYIGLETEDSIKRWETSKPPK